MKKILVSIVILSVLVFSGTPDYAISKLKLAHENDRPEIVTLSQGAVGESDMLLLVEKDGVRYQYAVPKDEISQYPLQMGSGVYTVRLMAHIQGNRYKEVESLKIDVEAIENDKLYTQSISEINWSSQSDAVIKAKQLTDKLDHDLDQIQAIYTFVTQNIAYDYEKASTVKSGYIPDIDEIYKASTGICYDYSALFASMTRSLGIPTKMVKGYSEAVGGQYHAWNEVYVNGAWHVVDTTIDAAYSQAGYNTELFKLASKYTAAKVY
ncbi:transglutaminase-like domain-containing protein [Fusibacter tunisiensis]|uniref:Transglutaminase-like putative cysteine protease n=1 Tax=Fusibacter tunisiensis TaxID=1008308 RepID=A0ABS2MRG1_9FIRM|nr:transglutaminase-like domain-containing protein [Fusibacter tunisiensis]MBM7561957.1 transglutaminase-like putative cysteine protease [Fusibacter tunisiensis]